MADSGENDDVLKGIAIGLFTFVNVPLVLWAAFIFVKNYNKRPFAARSTALLAILLPLLVFSDITDITIRFLDLASYVPRNNEKPYQCMITMLNGFPTIMILFFRSQLKYIQDEKIGPVTRFFLKYKHFASDRYLVSLGVILNLIFFTVVTLTSLAYDTCNNDATGFAFDFWAYLLWIGARNNSRLLTVSEALVQLVLIFWFLRKVKDPFYMKSELAMGSIIIIFIIVFAILTQDTFDEFRSIFITLIISDFQILIIYIYPYYRYKWNNNKNVEKESSKTSWSSSIGELDAFQTESETETVDFSTLEGTLENEKTHEMFKKHLAKEFKVELILFYDAVQNYKNLPEGMHEAHAHLIFQKFINFNSYLEITTLSAKYGKSMSQELDEEGNLEEKSSKIKSNYFDECLSDVLLELKTLWNFFKKSPEFKKLAKKKKKLKKRQTDTSS